MEAVDGGPDITTSADAERGDIIEVPDIEDVSMADSQVETDAQDAADREDTPPADVDLDAMGMDSVANDVAMSRCGDGVVDSGEDCDDGNTFNSDGCTTSCRFGARVNPPSAGDVIFTELMLSPGVATTGQWLELRVVGPAAVNLAGCTLTSGGARFELPEVVASRQSHVTIAKRGVAAENGGFAADIVVSGLLLDPTSGALELSCPFQSDMPVVIDIFAWSDRDFPVIAGRSLSLDPDRQDGARNDDPRSWCPGSTRFGQGDRGSPGADNSVCPALDRLIDGCTLVAGPNAGLPDFSGAATASYVDVYERGLTDVTDGADPSPILTVEVGFGSTFPIDATWRWTAATAFDVGVRSGSDRYRGDLVFPAVATYKTLGRASRDGGIHWTYCDVDGQSVPGIGSLGPDSPMDRQVLPNPCDSASCVTPPPAACADDTVSALLYGDVGGCTPRTIDSFDRDYHASSIDCRTEGRICNDGACDGIPRQAIAGDLAFNEVLLAPDQGAVWLEIANRTGVAVSLAGCALEGDDGLVVLPAHAVLAPNDFLLLSPAPEVAPVESPASSAAVYWGDVPAIDPAGGHISLRCESAIVASWSWQAPDWAWTGARPLGLSPWARADEEATRARWCVDDFSPEGSPGSRNADCPLDVVPVETCRIVVPATTAPSAGSSISVVVRFKARPATATSIRTDVSSQIIVEGWLGAGADAPGLDAPGWFLAAPDTSWIAAGSNVDAAEDRYLLNFRAPAVGGARLWVRATADGGNREVLCDIDGIVGNPATARPLVLTPVPGPCDPDPCGLAPVSRCDGDLVMGAGGGASCRVVSEGVAAASCLWPEVVLESCAAVGARCELGACTDYPRRPAVGEVVFSELMVIPASNENGEWIELSNVRQAASDLAGCELRSGGPGATIERWVFPAGVALQTVVARQTPMVVARSMTGHGGDGVVPRFVWTALSLDNRADWLELVCGETIIDRVAWDSADGWVLVPGSALSLSASAQDGAANDVPGAWCRPRTASPGAANPLCRRASDQLVSCRVAVTTAPASLIGDEQMRAILDVREIGVTDHTDGFDAATDTRVDFALVPAATPSFSFRNARYFEAAPVFDVAAAPALAVASDRWAATFVPGVSGAYRLLGRYSIDAGQTYSLCDAVGLVSPPAPSEPLSVAIQAGVCVPNPCVSPPPASCSGNTLIWKPSLGSCTRSLAGVASCNYSSNYFSCWYYGGCDATTATCVNSYSTPSQPGDLVITEVMRQPLGTDAAAGEWIEFENRSGAELDLNGCELTNETDQRFTFESPGPFYVAAGGRTSLWGASDSGSNGGVYLSDGKTRELKGFRIANVAGVLTVRCGGLLIDTVAWGPGWPGSEGVTMQLSADAIDAAANDAKAAWCASVSTYGQGSQRGTPDRSNAQCP